MTLQRHRWMLISVQRARSLRNSCLGTPANVLIDIVLKDVTKSRRRAPLTAPPSKATLLKSDCASQHAFEQQPLIFPSA